VAITQRGSGLNAIIKKYDDGSAHPGARKLALAKRLIRWPPVWLFLLVAWYLFRREVSSVFKPGRLS
jgi:hypothetical protein